MAKIDLGNKEDKRADNRWKESRQVQKERER